MREPRELASSDLGLVVTDLRNTFRHAAAELDRFDGKAVIDIDYLLTICIDHMEYVKIANDRVVRTVDRLEEEDTKEVE